jgi:hypothetical protein
VTGPIALPPGEGEQVRVSVIRAGPVPATTRPGRDRYDDIVDAIVGWHAHCRASRVFSMPCVKRSGRVVFGLSRTGMVFKLTDPGAHARALGVPGAHLFDPSGQGKPFRQWVVVPPERSDEWEALAYEAVGQDHSLGPPGPDMSGPYEDTSTHSGPTTS